MEKRQLIRSSAGIALTAAAALIAALVLSVIPNQAWAAVDCGTLLAGGVDPGTDSDNDGFTDFQECKGITLADGVSFVPSCANLSPPFARTACLDPNSKDLFVIYAPAASGSLLPVPFNPFGTVTAYGVTFNGLSALGITVHQIASGQAAADRTVMSTNALLNPSVSTERAVRVAESIDTNGTILGNCQWGKPGDLDGCVVYTQRIQNFVASTCTGLTIVTSAGLTSNTNDVLIAYATHTFLHETGHSTGGMTPTYNSSYGGYHYKCGAATLMEQCVTYSTKGGKCSFNISSGWNTTISPTDQSTIKLK